MLEMMSRHFMEKPLRSQGVVSENDLGASINEPAGLGAQYLKQRHEKPKKDSPNKSKFCHAPIHMHAHTLMHTMNLAVC